jgi:glycosyltransferase involved in cell wall biosynthesis
MKKIVVIPAYNAESTLPGLFAKLPGSMRKQISLFIIVNDGSTDKTSDAICQIKKKGLSIISVAHKKNMGYGAAQKTGYLLAMKKKADIIVLLHADGQYPPEMLNNLISPIEKGEADIAAGSRILGGNMYRQGMPLYKYLGNLCLTSFLNISLDKKLSSYHSGYKAYNAKALKTIPYTNFSNYFYFDKEMLISAVNRGLRIKEIPIPTRYGKEISHLNPIKYGFGILKIIIKNIIHKY